MKVHGIFATTIILLGGCGLSPLELDAADLGVSSPAPKWRVQDWTATRVRGRMQEVSPSSILPGGEVGTPDMATGQEGPVREVDWLISTSAPVNAASAVSGMFTTSSATDSLYFAINGAGGGTVGINNATHVNNHISALTTANVFKLVNLYATHPSVVWYASIPAVNGNGIALSIDGSKVYVLDSGGTLRCYQAGATTAPRHPPSLRPAQDGRTIAPALPYRVPRPGSTMRPIACSLAMIWVASTKSTPSPARAFGC